MRLVGVLPGALHAARYPALVPVREFPLGGHQVSPRVLVAYALLDQDSSGQLHLKEHRLFRGFESPDIYELVLQSLAEQVQRLAPREALRMCPPHREELLAEYRSTVDLEELERWFWGDLRYLRQASEAGSVKKAIP